MARWITLRCGVAPKLHEGYPLLVSVSDLISEPRDLNIFRTKGLGAAATAAQFWLLLTVDKVTNDVAHYCEN